MSPLRGVFKRYTARAFKNPPVDSRHELVVALALIFFIGGMSGAFLRWTRPQTVVDLVPTWVAVFWLFDLIIGGFGLMYSIFVKDRIDALIYEWPSVLYISVGALVYGLALATKGTATAFFACVTFSVLGVMCLARAVRVMRYLRKRGTEHHE